MRPPELTMELMAEHAIHITQQPNFTYTLEGATPKTSMAGDCSTTIHCAARWIME